MIAEFGSVFPLRFATAKMVDSSGDQMLCKCGKAAGSAIIGQEAFMAFCEDCSPTSKHDSLELIYRQPDVNHPKFKEVVEWLG